jgi:predicted CXXCH cytochrome family protein
MTKSLRNTKTYLFLVFVFFAAVSAFLIPDTSFSQQFPDCLQCHKIKVAGKYDHPTTCVSCHTKAHITGTKEKFPRYLSASGVELCWGCHDKTKFSKKVGHPPVAKGECLSCHEVHTSDYKGLLLKSMPDECFMCHDKTKFENKSTHPPVANGMCTSCHDPHVSDFKKLLISAQPLLCFNCHDKNMFSGKKRVHGPVGSGFCTSCHEPHASPEKKLLLDEMPVVCFRCHSKSDFEGQKVTHAPVARGMCMSCHTPHQSDNKELLLVKIPTLCFSCHVETGFTLKNAHPPVSAGMCLVCHEPHASQYKALLYHSINNGCLLCHPGVAQQPHAIAGVKQTGHPLKTKNTKVVDGEKIKLSCISCHDPHSSEWMKLFRYEAHSSFEICKYCHKK